MHVINIYGASQHDYMYTVGVNDTEIHVLQIQVIKMVLPKLFDSRNKVELAGRFYLSAHKMFQFMPKVFCRVIVW